LIDTDAVGPARALATAVDEQVAVLQLLTGEKPADALLVQTARTFVGDDEIDAVEEQQAIFEWRESLVDRVQIPTRLGGHVLWPPSIRDHPVGRVHQHQSFREALAFGSRPQ